MLKGYIIEKYSRMTGAYTCNRLVEEAGKRGIDLKIVGIADTMVDEAGQVFHLGTALSHCDFVINRYKYGHVKDAIGSLASRTYNEAAAFNIYINKYEQVRRLHSDGFLMPQFLLGTAMTAYDEIVGRLGTPFVAKGLESSQGAEIFLIESPADLADLGKRFPADKEYLFEEYIAASYGRDIRFYSIRGEVIACMTREAKEGFKANVALGAGVRAYPIDDDIRQTAKDIYEQTGLDFLGIDLLFGKDKPYFCEINVMPGIEGMERATGVNVAGAILDTILHDFVSKAEDYVYASYLKAEPYLEYDAPDSVKRNPLFSKEIIRSIQKEHMVPTVLVTGSKGKGSVAKMIAAILGTGCRTGLMTSPHILDFKERFRVQGEPVSDKALGAAIARIKPAFDAVEETLKEGEYISPMGIQTAAALTLFQEACVEAQVLECGKGVAYDDVNNAAHSYAVINRIFLEHTRELGGTLAEIAENKAQIMTSSECEESRRIAFTAEQSPEVMDILKNRAKKAGWQLRAYGTDFWCENIVYTKQGMRFDVVTGKGRYADIQIPLLGTYQAKNCALAMAVCEQLAAEEATLRSTVCEQGLSPEKVRKALKNLEWPGRLEVLSSEPLMLLDACIHKASCANVLEALAALKMDRITTIIGIPADKDYLGVTEAMQSVSKHIILTKSSNPHYKFGEEQIETLRKAGIEAVWRENLLEAVRIAQAMGGPICILGTTSLISDVKRLAATPMPLTEEPEAACKTSPFCINISPL